MVGATSFSLKRSWLLIVIFGCLWSVCAELGDSPPQIASCSPYSESVPAPVNFLETSGTLTKGKRRKGAKSFVKKATAACSCALPGNLLEDSTARPQPKCPFPHILTMSHVPSPIRQKPRGSIPTGPTTAFVELEADISSQDNAVSSTSAQKRKGAVKGKGKRKGRRVGKAGTKARKTPKPSGRKNRRSRRKRGSASTMPGRGPQRLIPAKNFLPTFFKEVRQVTMVPARSSFMCVDSRQAHYESLRTWGGDFLEMARALTYAYDRGVDLRQAQVDSILYSWIDTPLSDPLGFHYTTDVEAVVRMTAWLKETYGIKGHKLVDLVNPSKALQPFLLKALMLPAHHGNVCLRLALENEGIAGTQTHVIQMLIRSFFNLLWRKDYIGENGPIHNKLSIIITNGLHEPKAFVSVRDSKKCRAAGMHAAVGLGYNDEVAKRNIPSFLQLSAAEEIFIDYQQRREQTREAKVAATGVAAAILEQEKERQTRAEKTPDTTGTTTGSITGATVSSGLGAEAGASGMGSVAREDVAAAAAVAVAEEIQHRAVNSAHDMVTAEQNRRAGNANFLETHVAVAARVDTEATVEVEARTTAGGESGVAAAAGTGAETSTATDADADVDLAAGAELWAEMTAEEASMGAQEAEKVIQELDPEFVSFLSQFGLDANALKAVDDDDHAAGLAVDVIGGEMMRSALLQQDDWLVNVLSSSMGTEWANKVTNAIEQAVHGAGEDKGENGSLLEVDNTRAKFTRSKYRKQQRLPVLIFNEHAVLSQRKAMLGHLLRTVQLGTLRAEWPRYRKRSIGYDQLYKRVFAAEIPHYVMYVE